MKKIGLIFDFDGVIISSEPVHARAWEDTARQFGRTLPKDFIKNGTGHTDESLAEKLSFFWGGTPGAPEITGFKRQAYIKRTPAECTLTPGAAEILESFFKKFPMALATNSIIKDIEGPLTAYKLYGFFEAILTLESVKKPKPDPEIYLAAAAALGLHPSSCWIFEDSPSGIQAARDSGAKVVGITTSFKKQELSPADAFFPDFRDITAISDLLQEYC